MSVPGWRVLASERRLLYSPIGLTLVDEFTGRGPLGRVRAFLDLRVSPGVWHATGIEPIQTPSNVLTWPGLGRSGDPVSAPTPRYRARLEADLYRPDYLAALDGLEFDAPLWDDATPPVPVTATPQPLFLLPAPSYDFPSWVRVLRGVVEDTSGVAVPNALVQQATTERTLTDASGAFALSLRWATGGLPVDATDVRTGRTGTHTLSLPADLRKNVTITIA
jgi:hypothetical protein